MVGVGDMSGDVFGNGALLSRKLKIVAAFDHRHIFLDPNPDMEVSFKERARMFALPRSSWDDYNKELISAGGGVFPRTARTIELSPEIRAVLDIEETALAPEELMHRILWRQWTCSTTAASAPTSRLRPKPTHSEGPRQRQHPRQRQ
jgi:glutamate dehydrogenase